MISDTNDENDIDEKIAILGGGNLGVAISKGLVKSGRFLPEQIIITRRQTHLLEEWSKKGYGVQKDNLDAVKRSTIIIIAVRPKQMVDLLEEIKSTLIPEKHTVISVVSGVNIIDIQKHIGEGVAVVRAMPNIAIGIGESMTCLSSRSGNKEALDTARGLFDSVGKTLVIDETLMTPATALCACGIAFSFRAIRAASQGGIQVGFHSDDALMIAAQTLKGAAEILLNTEGHPEAEIDKVTTPRGCTIAGLNEMEHRGFSSAMIRGIVTSSDKASSLFENQEE